MQLHHMFIKTAKKYPNKNGVFDTALNRGFTYKEMMLVSFFLAHKLSMHEKRHIGIMIPTSAMSVCTIIASMFCGKIPVMINYAMGAEKNCLYAQKKCDFKIIVTSKKLLELRKITFIPGMIFIEDLLASFSKFEKLKALIKTISPFSFVKSGKDNDDAFILFTSGSEKDPKAVRLTHKNIMANISGIMKSMEYYHQDVFLGALPLFHIFGMTTAFWLSVYLGAKIVTHPSPLDYKKIVKSVKSHKITVMLATPTFYYGYLLRSKPGDFESVRVMISGGDKLPLKLLKSYQEKHNIRVLDGYGTTETAPVIAYNTLTNFKAGSVGRPLSNIKIKIVDINTGKSLPNNKEGKILARGPSIMKGYLNEAKSGIEDGWYDTGDMGLLDQDDYLWHKGRLKRFSKIAGEMISHVYLESKIQSLCPKEVKCCVVEIPHPTKGAEIVATVTSPVDDKMILSQLSEEVEKIALPRRFYHLKELPVMGNGKIDFRKVSEIIHKHNTF